MVDGYYDQIIQFLAMCATTEDLATSQKKQLVVKALNFQLIAGQLYKLGLDDILCQCVQLHEQGKIFAKAHAGVASGHYVG